jgi:hypothetical protein
MSNREKVEPRLKFSITLWRRWPDAGWVQIRRYNRYSLDLPDDWEQQTDRPAIAQVTCPGCNTRMNRMYMNLSHECAADLDQPEYTPAYKIRTDKKRQERYSEWTRKNTTLAAQYGITIQETENSFVVDYSQAKLLKTTGNEGLVRIVTKSEKK